jgi:hypothetical protein
MRKRSRRVGPFLMSAALLLVAGGDVRAGDTGPAPGSYRIVDGKADWGTYAGWFTYHLSCHMCHGQDATGSDVAPDLRKSMKTMTAVEFANKVLARYRLLETPADASPAQASPDSAIGEVQAQRRGKRGRVAMPVWLEDPGMKPHILDLYAYLKARSDGVLGPGRPRTMDE